MTNPWLQFKGTTTPYILETDLNHIKAHPAFQSGPAKVIPTSFPQPFIGNLESARIVFLALNPGHGEQDKTDHRDNEEFKQAMLLNLHQKHLDLPFYALDTRFEKTGAGQWWRARTKSLVKDTGLTWDTLAKHLMVIEWFPYHSASFSLPKQELPSQQFSFELVRKALDAKKLVIVMRSKSLWTEKDDRLHQVPRLKNPRSGHISVGNCDTDTFAKIAAALK